MLDPKLVRFTPEVVAEAMRRRHKEYDLAMLVTLEERRRDLLTKVEALKAERNAVSQQIAALKKRKEDAAGHIEALRRVGEEIKRLDEEAGGIEVEFTELLMAIPNLPDAGVPDGATKPYHESHSGPA